VVGWLWFLAALIPVIGIVKAGLQDTADRYAYVPSIGLTVALAWTAPDLLKPWQARAKAFLLWGSSIAVLSVMAGLCARQVSYWRDTDTLFRHALRVTRDNYFAETHLAVDLLRQKRDELVPEAVARLQRAVELAPHFREAHSNLAIALYLNQDYAGAWREVHWLRRHGGPLAPEFVAMLAQRMPEPKS
jgi:tetratricopeptide (TPR) repeat protein